MSPAWSAHRTQRGQGGKDAARPGSLRRNATSGELRRRGAAALRRGHGTDAGEKGRSSARVNMARRLWGSCEDVKRPACDANGRPARVEAAAWLSEELCRRHGETVRGHGHSNRRIERSKRRTHSGLCGNIPLGRSLGEPGSIPLVHPGLRERTPRFLRQRNTGKT